MSAGSGAAAHGVPTSAGVTRSIAQDTLVADYNDISTVESYFDAYHGQIAGVIVEPIAANMGVVRPTQGFLEGLRRTTTANEALLIFDEVVSGYRVAYGGAQHLYGVTPDITCLGKIIGGGLPVGAYGGKREIMETVSPLGPMYQAGTLSGNPVAMAAGIKTLKLLQRPGIYEELDARAGWLAEGILDAFAAAETPLTINRVGSMMTLFFNPAEVTGWKAVSASDKEGFARFFHRMMDEGILPSAVTLRGHVRVDRPQRRRHPGDYRGGRASAALATERALPYLSDGIGHAGRTAVHRRAGHQHTRTGLHHGPRRAWADTTVHLQLSREATLVKHLPNASDLAQRALDKRLAPEAGVNCHDQHQVQVTQHLLDGRHRRGRADGYPRLQSGRLDLVDCPIQVFTRLGVNGDNVGAGLCKFGYKALGLSDHHVHVQGDIRPPPYVPHDLRDLS